MSFILDALKKSESERQRQSGPALLEMHIVRPSRALPVWAMVVGALLILSVGVLAWLALRPATQHAGNAAQLAAGAVRPAASGANDSNRNTDARAQAGAATESVLPGAPAASPAVADHSAGATANTADGTDGADGADAAEAPANPADSAPAVSANPDSPPTAAVPGNLQNYAALSGAVPELRLDLHVYSQNPADRYAFINMHKVREGDTTPEGVQVRQITREGVVLEYRGAEFLLGR